MPNILDLSARLSADVKPFVNSMGSSAQSSRTTFQNIAQAATMYLGGRGLLGTLQRASEASRSFGQSLADASAISTLSVKEIQQALMSLDNVFGRVSKASSSMYRILSSGFSQLDAKQLMDFQKAVGVSAKVIRADLYDTADVMTTIANAYQLNIKQIEKLQDWFYITVREGKAQGQDLARTLGLVINSASEAGVSLNELGAAIAVLSRTQSASQSMIGLNQMLNAFIKPTLQAKAAAREWGIELSASAIQNKSLIEILTELNKKVGGNVEALEAMFGNIRAGRAILSITGKQFKNYNQVLKMYEAGDGAGLEAFLKQIDTVENAYERLQAQQEKTLITVGDDWSGVLKKVYGTGELALKAFTDISPFNRWVIYLSGIGLAVKNIISVVRNLQSSIDATTRSVNNLASAFNRTSLSSAGLRGIYHGVRPDTMVLRKELDSALRTVSSPYGVLSARYKNVMAQTTPYTWGNPQQGGFFKDDAYAFIAKHILNPDVTEHREVARSIARKLMANRFVKYKDIVDANGNVIDWNIMNVETGRPYTKTYKQYEEIMTKSVIRQNKLAEQAMRGDLGSALKLLSGSRAAKSKLEAAADARIGAFYSNARGARVSSLYNMTSMERLSRMRGKGIFQGGFWKSIGKDMGTTFSAVAAVGLVSAVAEAGYRFGSAVSEKLEVSESTFIRRLGGWLAQLGSGGSGKLSNIDSKESIETAFRNQIDTLTMRYKQSIDKAKKLGMDAQKIAEYQLSFMNIFGSGSDLENTHDRLKELVDTFVAGLEDINSGLAEANKFELERKQILDTYKNARVDELFTSNQKVAIKEAAMDRERHNRNQTALRLANEAFNTNDARSLNQKLYQLRSDIDAGGNWETNAKDFMVEFNHKLLDSILNALFSGDITLGGLQDISKQLQADQNNVLKLNNGRLEMNGTEGFTVTSQLVDLALRLANEFPNNRDEAVQELADKKFHPYTSSLFNQLISDLNKSADEIGNQLVDLSELPLELEDRADVLLAKAKKSEQKAKKIREDYGKWLADAFKRRAELRELAVKTIMSENTGITEEEAYAIVDKDLEQLDKVFGPQAEGISEKAISSQQTALSQSLAYYKEQVKKITNSDNRLEKLSLREAAGTISYDDAFRKRMEIYDDMLAEYDKLLASTDLSDDTRRALEGDRLQVQLKKTQLDTSDLQRHLGDSLSDSLDKIQLQAARKRISDTVAIRRRISVYKNEVELLNGELKSIENKESERYLELLRKRREFLTKIAEDEQSLKDAVSQKRSQLMDSVSGVINSNIENGYLTSYGLHHAMNMLAKLKSGFAYDLGGASLKDVLNNAHARYSGYTPNTSKAMQAQHKLSEIMDAYITAKQYEDAGIGKNVETIVTLMGKRQPLYLN